MEIGAGGETNPAKLATYQEMVWKGIFPYNYEREKSHDASQRLVNTIATTFTETSKLLGIEVTGIQSACLNRGVKAQIEPEGLISFDKHFIPSVVQKIDHHPQFTELILNSVRRLTAHEMYHLRELKLFPKRRKAEQEEYDKVWNDDQKRHYLEIKHNFDWGEVAASTFADEYMRSRPTKNFKEGILKFISVIEADIHLSMKRLGKRLSDKRSVHFSQK